MKWLWIALNKLWETFFDDKRFAFSIMGWLFVCHVVLPRGGTHVGFAAATLFFGLVVILVESAARLACNHPGQ